MFVRGRVATNDGSTLPNNVLVERICSERVRQQVYASVRGDFSMDMGSMANSVVDASAEPVSQSRSGSRPPGTGIPRRELANCDLRVSAAGFRPARLSLVEVSAFGESIDVGAIVVQRTTKVKGLTLSAIPYKAPKNARRAYEKGLEAEENGKLANARTHFEKAVEIYPKFANAWFELGTVLRKQNQKDAARTAYVKAATVDGDFLQPYLPLALMACEAGNWTEVLSLTNHILELDPFRNAKGYILDLDQLNYAEAYFYASVANFKLNRLDEAEKSALKAEQNLRTRPPQLHLLLAEIFARKDKYSNAIEELQSYLELVPHAKNADEVRQQLAELRKLNGSASTGEKPEQN